LKAAKNATTIAETLLRIVLNNARVYGTHRCQKFNTGSAAGLNLWTTRLSKAPARDRESDQSPPPRTRCRRASCAVSRSIQEALGERPRPLCSATRQNCTFCTTVRRTVLRSHVLANSCCRSKAACWQAPWDQVTSLM